MLGGLSLMIRKVLAIEATKTILAFVSSRDSKRVNIDQGTLIFGGVDHLEDVDCSQRREMEQC